MHAGEEGGIFTAIVRAAGDPGALTGPARRAVSGLDRDLPIRNLRTASVLYDSALAQRRFLLRMVGVSSILAIVLAAIGIYGLVAYDVATRSRELGVRAALGADRRRLAGEVVRAGLGHAAIGIALGIAVALALSRFLAGYVFGVAPTDPLTLSMVALTMTGVCALALLVPAMRAAAVQPTDALRVD
jgi:putative ABC transport system permease protein